MPTFRALICTFTVLLGISLTAPTLIRPASGVPPQAEQARTGHARLLPPETAVARSVPFDLMGQVSTQRVKREVMLQRRMSGKWRTMAVTQTDRRGKFTFEHLRLSSSTWLRGLLPAHDTRVAKSASGPRAFRTLPEVMTKTIFLRTRALKGRLVEMPPINQQGPVPASPREDTVVSAQFDPPVPGRRVLLERRVARGRWVRQGVLREDAAGFAVFNVPANATYRATAKRFKKVSPVQTNRARTVTRSLIFEDTFNGITLDPRWRDFAVPRGYPGSGRTCALAHPSQRSVGGGVLRLGIGYDPTKADQECSYTGPDGIRSSPYLYQSQVATWKSFRFTHGIASARIKFSRARGRHSAFWIQVDKVAGDPADGTEIDVVEFFGESEDRDLIGSFLHYVGPDGYGVQHGEFFQTMSAMKPPGDTWWDSFHVFSVAWTPTEYVFRVDGREYYRENRAISMTPQWLVLSATSSDYELGYITPQNISEETEVDWVRVWSL